MTKPELGVKRDCPECGTRFYDLNKEPAHCPKCEHEFVPEALLKPRRARKEDDEPAPVAAKPASKETSLEAADKEKLAAKSKRQPGLDEDSDDDDDDDDELAGIGDIDVDLDDDDDDEDDDSLLDDDDDDDMTAIVKPSGEDND
ncbi:TIGR02300 family protein [Hyphococcus sp.]|uniref:TIGR02300 family protein n=1 Tax=Hyphococcus sp. TaxID=2038636 RepID=UPI0020825A15|nr:MAG: hypothetical protein DHS20C04_23670 [Marinicaulis sp.]